MSKQAGNLAILATGAVVIVVAGIAYELLRGGCILAEIATGRRPI